MILAAYFFGICCGAAGAIAVLELVGWFGPRKAPLPPAHTRVEVHVDWSVINAAIAGAGYQLVARHPGETQARPH